VTPVDGALPPSPHQLCCAGPVRRAWVQQTYLPTVPNHLVLQLFSTVFLCRTTHLTLFTPTPLASPRRLSSCAFTCSRRSNCFASCYITLLSARATRADTFTFTSTSTTRPPYSLQTAPQPRLSLWLHYEPLRLHHRLPRLGPVPVPQPNPSSHCGDTTDTVRDLRSVSSNGNAGHCASC
jgi:hypothetical protein